MTFGETVKSLRESKNLTQKQLGEQIGISRPTINLWERGKVKPTKPETVEKLANALGVTVKDLIGDEVLSVKEKKAAPKKEKAAADAEEKPIAVGDAEKEPITSTEIPIEEVPATPAEEAIADTGEMEKPVPATEESVSLTEEKISSAPIKSESPSSEAISLATRLAILLPELSASEKDSVMVSLNAAYWRSR